MKIESDSSSSNSQPFSGDPDRAAHTRSLLLGTSSFLIWGLLPIYWKTLGVVPAYEILANRVFWSFIFMIVVLVAAGKVLALKLEVKQLLACRKKIFCVIMGAILISANWFVFIWAVNDGRMVETSLGYYINPLINVLIGVTILRERLSLWQFLAVLLATAGVVKLTLNFGSLPWVALFLACSMGTYSLCKKVTGLSAISGLSIETALTAPLAGFFLIYIHSQGQGYPFGADLTTVLLIGAGVVTATPLLLFAHSLNHLSMTVMGFLQYISPTLTLILGIFVYGEDFTPTHRIAFSFIWAAVILFTVSRTAPMVAIERGISRFLGRKRS
ncbi:EamA family transporter RarD [Deltaproteobacteria bacterium Smac51]|nr:EamA family transporter RarD [Deltaproteobacteria bacterium Smac51]